jgi:hypothetical protein
MQDEGTTKKLEELRERLLGDLSGLSDQLVGDDDTGYEGLLVLARTTGRAEFLEKALQRCEAMEDGSDKANALLDLLGAVDLQLGARKQPAQDGGATQSTEDQNNG